MEDYDREATRGLAEGYVEEQTLEALGSAETPACYTDLAALRERISATAEYKRAVTILSGDINDGIWEERGCGIFSAQIGGQDENETFLCVHEQIVHRRLILRTALKRNRDYDDSKGEE